MNYSLKSMLNPAKWLVEVATFFFSFFATTHKNANDMIS